MSTLVKGESNRTRLSEPKVPAPEVSVEWVTPDQAREWLLYSDRNRTKTPGSIGKLRRAIDAGGWKLTPDAISWNSDGELDNGQHRLTLVAEGEEPRQFIVVRNMPPDSWDATDKGKGRSFADTLARRGEKNTVSLAATLRILHKYERTGDMAYNSGGTTIPEPDLLEFLHERSDVRVAVREARSTVKTEFVAVSATATLFYCFWKARSYDDAVGFFNLVRSPEGLHEGSAVLALKKRLDEDLAARARRSFVNRLDEVERRALFIIAFNKWMAGERVKLLVYRPGGARPDRFPIVRGYEPLARFL